MPMRITGMGSGMDIDKLVSDLMKAERMPLNQMNQKKQMLSWKTDRYREINTQLSTYRDFLNGMRFTGSWTQSKAASSDLTKVTVSADATATPGTHTIDVIALAKGANKVSSSGISITSLTGGVLSGSTAITAGTNDQMNVTLNGVNKTITVAAGASYSNTALQSALQSAIDTAFGANQITVGLVGGNQLSLTPNGTAGNLPQLIVGTVPGNTGVTALGFTDQQPYKINVNAQLGAVPSKLATSLTFGDFVINGQSISYTSTDTLATIMSKVNSSAAGVNMTYDSITDKVTFTTKGTGATAKVQLANGGSGNFITAMNLDTIAATGTDAHVIIDNVDSYRSSNSFTLNGVTYNLASTTTSTVNVTVTRDTDYIFNKIKDFVSKYNDTIGLATQRLKEVKFRDYPPLTDDQKLNMKDSDIKLWEDKAKSGLLQNDDILSNLSTSLRSFISSTVQSISTSYNTLYKVGITSIPYNSSAPNDAGKMQLDESKLRAAIAQDPDGVISLFSNQPADGATSKKGIAQAMYDQANTSITSLIKRAGGIGTAADNISTDLGFQLSKLGTKISNFNSKLASVEANYYRKFGAMDKAMQKSNSQISWLSQQFK